MVSDGGDPLQRRWFDVKGVGFNSNQILFASDAMVSPSVVERWRTSVMGSLIHQDSSAADFGRRLVGENEIWTKETLCSLALLSGFEWRRMSRRMLRRLLVVLLANGVIGDEGEQQRSRGGEGSCIERSRYMGEL